MYEIGGASLKIDSKSLMTDNQMEVRIFTRLYFSVLHVTEKKGL